MNRATGAAAFANLAVGSPVLTLSAATLAFEPQPNGGLAVSGSGNAVADLNRLGRMLHLQSDPKGADALRGRATGPVRFRWSGDTTTFGGTLDVKDFAYGDPAKTGIAEKSRVSYIPRARLATVDVSHSGENVTGRNGLPKMSRRSATWCECSPPPSPSGSAARRDALATSSVQPLPATMPAVVMLSLTRLSTGRTQSGAYLKPSPNK